MRAEEAVRRLPWASSWMSDQWEEAEWASHVWFWGRGSVVLAVVAAVDDGSVADMVILEEVLRRCGGGWKRCRHGDNWTAVLNGGAEIGGDGLLD